MSVNNSQPPSAPFSIELKNAADCRSSKIQTSTHCKLHACRPCTMGPKPFRIQIEIMVFYKVRRYYLSKYESLCFFRKKGLEKASKNILKYVKNTIIKLLLKQLKPFSMKIKRSKLYKILSKDISLYRCNSNDLSFRFSSFLLNILNYLVNFMEN